MSVCLNKGCIGPTAALPQDLVTVTDRRCGSRALAAIGPRFRRGCPQQSPIAPRAALPQLRTMLDGGSGSRALAAMGPRFRRGCPQQSPIAPRAALPQLGTVLDGGCGSRAVAAMGLWRRLCALSEAASGRGRPSHNQGPIAPRAALPQLRTMLDGESGSRAVAAMGLWRRLCALSEAASGRGRPSHRIWSQRQIGGVGDAMDASLPAGRIAGR